MDSCRCPPKRSLGERYNDALKSDPVKTKAATAFILSGLSALISKMQSNGWQIDGDVLTTAFQMALLSIPPLSHFWYPILDMLSKNPIIKTFIDQLFWRPLMIAYTFVVMNLFKGKSILEIKGILKDSFPNTVKNAWKIWPAAQFLNQTLVPIHLRTVSMDCLGFFWDMYLTLVITKPTATIQPPPPPLPPPQNPFPVLPADTSTQGTPATTAEPSNPAEL